MNDQQAIYELMNMTESEIDMVPFDLKKLTCSFKKCNRGTGVRNFGIHPIYYHKRMKWIDVSKTFFCCSKHWRFYKKLIKNYSESHVQEKILDKNKQIIIDHKNKEIVITNSRK